MWLMVKGRQQITVSMMSSGKYQQVLTCNLSIFGLGSFLSKQWPTVWHRGQKSESEEPMFGQHKILARS